MKLHFSTLFISVLGLSLLVRAASALPLGGAFDNRGSETEAQMRVEAAKQADKERTRFKSLKEENETFEGIFIPTSNSTKLAVLSDDGVTVSINGTVTNVANFGKGQHGPKLAESFYLIGASFQAGRTYQIKIDYSNTSYKGESDYDGMTLFAYNGGGKVQEVNLIISHGQSGFAVPDDEEETVGAFTVANLNNTDGDAIVDNSDNSIVGEKDLMALEISKPAGLATDKLTVKVTSGQARLWQAATKGTPVPLVNGAAEFTLADLPKTIYLEATTTSQTLRDISVELDYKGQKDTIKATGVWAAMTGVEHDQKTAAAILAQQSWADLTTPPKNILDALGGTGLRPANSPLYVVVNAILIQFTVQPAGVQQYDFVKFDVSRQAHARAWSKTGDEDPFGEIGSPPFPKIFPTADEVVNDDPLPEIDESEEVTAMGHIYVLDAPGLFTIDANEPSDEIVIKGDFREFVRVSFDGTKPAGNLSGSRSSDKYLWHARHHILKSQFTGTWRRSTDDDNETAGNDIAPGAKTPTAP